MGAIMDNSNVVKIGDRVIGPGNPVYVVAEIGINHNGDLDLAHKLIDGAATAGADAVKFQIVYASELAQPGNPHYDTFLSLELSDSEWVRVVPISQ